MSGVGGCKVRFKLNKFDHVQRGLGLSTDGTCPLPMDRKTRLKTLPSRNFVGGQGKVENTEFYLDLRVTTPVKYLLKLSTFS